MFQIVKQVRKKKKRNKQRKQSRTDKTNDAEHATDCTAVSVLVGSRLPNKMFVCCNIWLNDPFV